MAQIANLQEPSAPVVAKPDYTSYVDYLEARGWRREQLTLDELNTNIVTLFGVAAGATGTVIEVRAPAGQKISIMGTQQIPRGADARSAHALRVRLAGTGDLEIPIFTKIRITKEKTSEAVVQLARVFYADVNLTKQVGVSVTQKTDLEWYRFKQGVELNGEQRLKIIAINTEALAADIDPDHIKFALDLDLWTREE
jgi:hypothetical protein